LAKLKSVSKARRSRRLLGGALDAGLNMIDTAWIASRPWFQLAAVSGGDRRA
jgi:hypothetical protein